MLNPKLRKMKQFQLITGLLIGLNVMVKAQCPVAGFQIPDSICPGLSIQINNNSSIGTQWNWDFSLGDLDSIPTPTGISGGGNVNFPMHMKVVEDGGNYYGFVPNAGTNYITRFDFGNSPANTPTSINLTADPLLGGFGSCIEMVKANNLWIGFECMNSNGKLIKIEFDSITQLTPTLTDLGSTNLFGPVVMKIIGDYMFVTNQLSDISRFSFNGSYSNAPTPILPTISTSYFNNSGIDIAYDCITNKYIGFVGAYSSNTILKLDFGNNLSNAPTITSIYTLNKPQGVHLVKEGNTWHLFSVTESNLLFHFTLGNSLDNNLTYEYDSNLGGTFGDPRNIQFIKKGSDWFGIVPNTSLFALRRLTFPQGSLIVPNTSSLQNPTNLVYPIGSTGMQYLELTETDVTGKSITYLDSVLTIILPPIAAFTNSPGCENSIVLFTDNSSICTGSINSWNWDFGDASTSSLQNPSHVFSSNGNFTISLTVYTSTGDSNTVIQTISISSNPVANFIFTDNICQGSQVAFIDSSTNTNGILLSWQWLFGDSTNDSSINPFHVYQSSGIFPISLIVTASSGCTDTIQKSVNILDVPKSNYSISNSCLGEIAQFTNLSTVNSGTIINYSWDFGDSQTSLLQNPSHNFGLNPGNFLVSLVANSDNGCSDTLSQLIRIGNKPQPWFTLNKDTACAGNNITITDSSFISFGDSITAHYWNFGDGTTDSAALNPSHTYLTPGNYVISLTVLSPTSCDSTITRNVFVINSPLANFSTANVCFGLNTNFNDLSVAPAGSSVVNWNWDFGDSDSISIQNPVHNYISPGFYNVSLKVIDTFGCSSMIVKTTQVYAIPAANFSNSKTCSNYNILFTDSSNVIGSTISTWNWNFGDATGNSSLQNPTHLYPTSASYPITLSITSSQGCSDTLIKYVIIEQTPNFTIKALSGCLTSVTSFLYQPIGLGTINPGYSWDFGDSTFAFQSNPLHLYVNTGSYIVSLSVTDLNNGCSSTVKDSLEIYGLPKAEFTSNNSCINDTIHFTDLSLDPNGFITNWNWKIGTYTNSTIQNPIFIPTISDSFPVKLVITNNIGCKDSVIHYAQTFSLPHVNFSATPIYGAPPLEVQFTNNSDFGTNTWNFGNGSLPVSTQNPLYIYQDTGSFTVKLIVDDVHGCVDSSNTLIRVVSPYLDLSLESINFYQENSYWNLSAIVRNTGILDIENFRLETKIQNAMRFSEDFNATAFPSGTIKKINFNTLIPISVLMQPDFICININKVNGRNDDYTLNNDKCTILGQQFVIYSVFPNPFKEDIQIEFSVPTKGYLNYTITNTLGEELVNSKQEEYPIGFHQIKIANLHLKSGMYFLEMKFGDKSIRTQILKN